MINMNGENKGYKLTAKVSCVNPQWVAQVASERGVTLIAVDGIDFIDLSPEMLADYTTCDVECLFSTRSTSKERAQRYIDYIAEIAPLNEDELKAEEEKLNEVYED